MAGRSLPEYQAWEASFKENWDNWEYYRNLYSYALQKPANTFFSSRNYPLMYQQRLLRKQYVENMQLLGEVKAEEVQEYAKVSKCCCFPGTYRYFTKGPYNLVNLWNRWGAAGWGCSAYWAWYVKKAPSWYIAPGLLFYVFSVGVQNRIYKLQLGSMVDMTEWALEKRKAEVWRAEMKKDFADEISMLDFWNQFRELAKSYKA